MRDEVEDGGEGCAGVLTAGGDSNRVVVVGESIKLESTGW